MCGWMIPSATLPSGDTPYIENSPVASLTSRDSRIDKDNLRDYDVVAPFAGETHVHCRNGEVNSGHVKGS